MATEKLYPTSHGITGADWTDPAHAYNKDGTSTAAVLDKGLASDDITGTIVLDEWEAKTADAYSALYIKAMWNTGAASGDDEWSMEVSVDGGSNYDYDLLAMGTNRQTNTPITDNADVEIPNGTVMANIMVRVNLSKIKTADADTINLFEVWSEGTILTIADDTRGARITGGGATNDDDARGARIIGNDTDSDARASRLIGKDTDSDARGARLIGNDTDSDARGARIWGVDTDSNARGARLWGVDTDSDTRASRIHGVSEYNDNRACRMIGGYPTTSARSARMIGRVPVSSARGARIKGVLGDYDGRLELDTVTYALESIDTTTFTCRGTIDTSTYTARSIGTTTHTVRSAIGTTTHTGRTALDTNTITTR